MEVYPENADLISFIGVCLRSSTLPPFHFFFSNLQLWGNYIEAAAHIPSCSLTQHVSGTVELFMDDVMNADIQLNRELVERVLIA